MSSDNFVTGYEGLLGSKYTLSQEETDYISQSVSNKVASTFNLVKVSGVSRDLINRIFDYHRTKYTRRYIDHKKIVDIKGSIMVAVIEELSNDIVAHYSYEYAKKDYSIWDGGSRRFTEDNSFKSVDHDPIYADQMFEEPRF